MEVTILSLVPPVLAILMVIFTRRVLLSLGIGIIAGAFVASEGNFGEAVTTILTSVSGIFVSDGELNTWNVYILLFLVLLGILTAFITVAGGSRAFGEWAMTKVNTKKGAQFWAAVAGVIIFIDDYFNSLAVGQISRPITDRQKVSRAKLAYIIDSTSAPICVVSPVSSWGAYIIALIGGILATHSVSNVTALSAFLQMGPMNLYVWVSLAMVFLVISFNLNIGPMKRHELRAEKEGVLFDRDKGDTPGELSADLPISEKGSITDLVLPIAALIVGTIGSMIITGSQAAGPDASLLAIFENTDVASSLLYGGLISVVVGMSRFATKKLSLNLFFKAIVDGVKSMVPAILILIFAWTIGTIIGEVGTGEYLASLVEKANLNSAYLPAILFIVAGIMAFATGTSWGTFGIMLPIAGEIAAATDIVILLPALSAVLAGSVFGDHCSPISDTTILSSTGAGSHHIDHVLTQLPYAIISAVITIIGYIILGLFSSVTAGLITVALLLIVSVPLLKKLAA